MPRHPRPLPAAVATVAATVMALGVLSGCSSDEPEAPATETSSSPSTSPTTSTSTRSPSPSTSLPATPSAALPAADYRRALLRLARDDTGYFELSVLSGDDIDDPDLRVFPRMAGGWRVRTEESMVTTTSPGGADGSLVDLTYLSSGGELYLRGTAERAPFGEDCWARLGGAGAPRADRPFGLPSVLALLDSYRPAGRPGAGTSSLAAVLGAIGFQKIANTNRPAVRGVRVPVTLRLERGEVAGATVYPADLLGALAEIDPAARSTAVQLLANLVDELTPTAWQIRYAQLGDPIDLSAPPADQLIDLEDPAASCPG